MGRIGTDQSHHQPPAAEPHPPPPLEEDLYEPPEDYQPPPPPAAAPEVHSFPPPPQDDIKPQSFPPQQETPQVQPFPPNQYYNNSPQQNQTYLPAQQINGNNMNNMNMNMNVPQQGIPMAYAPSPLMAQQNLLPNQPWNTHLFDCMKDPQNAIITLFFPCVTFGQIAEVLDNGSMSCSTSGILYSLIACCIGMPCLMSCGYRSKLRAKFGLAETPAPDWIIHCFCECCALCQEYRELNERGFDPSIGHAGNVAKQQRLQQFGMTPPLQQRMI